MAKAGKVIGHAPCPYCGDSAAEVKHDKRNNPYIICFECERPSQHFTLGDAGRIKAFFGGGKFKPLPGTELPEWAKETAPAPKPAPAPAPKEKPKSTILG